MRRGDFDQLHAANASVAVRDFSTTFGDARRDASQALAVALQEIDAWTDAAGRVVRAFRKCYLSSPAAFASRGFFFHF